MSKTTKNKGGKIPKLTEEEYAKYISLLRGAEEPSNPPKDVEKSLSTDTENEKK
jgi:hypothetical protein